MSFQAFTSGDGNVPDDAHPDIWLMVRYWQYIQPEGRLPGIDHFDLDDIPGLRPNLRLIDVVDGSCFQYRIRMIGEAHLQHLGYDPSGGWYETITGRFQNSIVELDLARVCQQPQPVYRKGATIVPYASGVRMIERVHVPLASDGNQVNGIASLTLFFPNVRMVAGSRSARPKPDGEDRPTSASAFRIDELDLAVAGMGTETVQEAHAPV